MTKRFKRITIPAAQQAGASSGVFPIDLSNDAQIQAAAFPTGRNIYVTEDDGLTHVPACLLPNRHVNGANGGWIWFTQPPAIYDPVGRKTLTGWVMPNGIRKLGVYDHDTDTSQEILLSTTDLEADDHNNPSICIRSDGRYLVAYCEHNNGNTMKFRVSTNPHDASSWQAEYSITPTTEGVLSYSVLIPMSSESKIYLIGRAAGADLWYYITSDDNGATWSSQVNFIDHAGFQCYPRFWWNGIDKILMVATKKQANTGSFINNDSLGNPLDLDGNKPIYAAQYSSGAWRNMNGTTLSLPISNTAYHASSIVVPDITGNDARWVGDITQDAQGVVHVLFYVYPDHNERDHDLYYSRYNSGSNTWETPSKVMDEGGNFVPYNSPAVIYPGVAVFDPLDATKIAVAREVKGIREIEIWQRSGITWAKIEEITANSRTHNIRPNYAWGRVAGVEPYLFWMGNGRYDYYEDWETSILQYPSRPASGLLVRLDLDGVTDRVLRVYYSDKNEDRLDEPQIVAANMGALSLYVGSQQLADNRHSRVNFGLESGRAVTNLHVQEDCNGTFAGIKFGQVGSDNNSRISISPAIEGSFRASVLAVVDWEAHPSGSGAAGILGNQNVGAGQTGVYCWINTIAGTFQFHAVLSSGVVSLASDAVVPQNTPTLVYGEFDRRDSATTDRLKVRVGTTQKVAAGANASFSTGVAANHAIGQERSSGTARPLQGTLQMVGIFENTLTKAYTDTLHFAFTSASDFVTIGQEQIDTDELIENIVAATLATFNADATQTTARTNAATAATQATAAALDASRIQRLANPIAAGAPARRTAIQATSTTLDESYGPIP